jgi:hypothetical protein
MSFEKKSGHPEVGPMPGLSDKSAIEAKRCGKNPVNARGGHKKSPALRGFFSRCCAAIT